MTDQPHSEVIPEFINLGEVGPPVFSGAASGRQVAWKFVLIKTKRRVHLAVGPVSRYRYHANLVDSFCRRFDIPASKSRGTQKVEIYDRSVQVLGGGHIVVNHESRRVRFYGQSTAYGPYDTDTVSEILKNHSFLSGYSVLVN